MSSVAKLAGVCGWPIHQSLSPLLHNFWLKELGISGAYVHFAVRPDEAHRAFRSLKKTSIAGVNVTMPLKRLAYEAADEHTPDAIKLGVSNCLYKRGGKLVAHNTDLEGFAAPLLLAMNARQLSETPTVVIGTGGAAKAVIGALLSLNVPEIRVLGRTDAKAEEIVTSVNLPSLYSLPWYERHESLQNAGLVINASAGGMSGKPELDLDISHATEDTLVYDLIYVPQKTKLLKQAKKAGCRTLGGLDMLIAQARPSFKLFYGVAPPAEADPKPILIEALRGRR